MKKQAAACLMVLLILFTCFGADAQENTEMRDNAPAGTPALTEDPDNGIWEYRSETLTIRIERFSETVKTGGKKKIREYCIADIHASPESPLFPVMTEPTKKHPAGYKLVSPDLLTEKYKPLFAMSDDMYGIRLQRYKYKGIVIRDGEIISDQTRNSAKKRPWPNLDTLAVFSDGSMKTYICDAYTAEEYLEMGATQVFSFGPILISDGKITDQVLNPKYYPYNEPRVAIGMVEPWHYVAIVVRGRPKSSHVGAHLDWVAQKLMDKGCMEALNLDGGQTATMIFNGSMIETGDKGLRSQGSLICFGTMSQ